MFAPLVVVVVAAAAAAAVVVVVVVVVIVAVVVPNCHTDSLAPHDGFAHIFTYTFGVFAS